MDPVVLARIQFATNISFHILFPTVTIALGWVLLFFKLRFNRSGDEAWMDAYRFWVKVFALSFALGVVSGITMSFQFGTNWPGFMQHVGNIAGPLLAYEILTAFFMEATFLGIMLFGFRRVPGWLHTLATVLVAVGTTISAFWILVLNSWMHTPQGFELRDGIAHATDWWAIVFNPSMPYRLTHMLLASALTVGFLVAGLSAWRWLKGDRAPGVRVALRTGIVMAALLAPLQAFVGDLHGLNTLEYQPAKIAAMEGHWEGGARAPLILFAIPDNQTETNHAEIAIPALSSLILTHEWDGVVPGLKQFPADERPNPEILFWTFRIMVAIGTVMLVVAIIHLVQRVRGRLYSPNWFHKLLVACMPLGFIAVLAGWFTTEIGRQPWVVQGLVRTSDGVTPALTGGAVLTSLIVFVLVYTVIYGAGTYYLYRLLTIGPAPLLDEDLESPAAEMGKRPKRPLSVPGESIEPAE